MHRRAWFVVSVISTLVLAIGCGGNSSANNDGGTDAPGTLPDDGPCEPGAKRCNGNNVQECNIEGTMWVTQETCPTFCAEGTCALDGLDIPSDMTLEGNVVVAGAVTIHSGATLSSTTGVLNIFADTITVEAGGAISVAPTGETPEGQGGNGACSSCTPGGGGYANRFGSDTDSEVQPGGRGGNWFQTTPPMGGGFGGGVVRLNAKVSIVVAGQISANGANGISDSVRCFPGGGGGSGGGVLLVADDVTFTGSISTAGGVGGPTLPACGNQPGQPGSLGRVKILHGSKNIVTGTIMGAETFGLAPPVPMRSSSHPDPKLTYNDGFLSLDVNWTKAFPSVMGYYVRLDQNPEGPPTAADGMFLGNDMASFSPNDVQDGENFVHIVSVDAQSAIGTVESVFRVTINTRGPSLSSTSHPNQDTFVNNTNPFFAWSYPQGDSNVRGTYYVLDSFGDTVPTAADTKLPADQKQLLKSGLAAGVYVLHVVSIDEQGRLSKAAGHYRVNIGSDPGVGTVQVNVVDAASQPVPGATVTVNRGLFSNPMSNGGTYTFNGVVQGTWEISVKLGARSATKMVTSMSGGTVTANVTLP